MHLSFITVFTAFALWASAFPIDGYNSQRRNSLWRRIQYSLDPNFPAQEIYGSEQTMGEVTGPALGADPYRHVDYGIIPRTPVARLHDGTRVARDFGQHGVEQIRVAPAGSPNSGPWNVVWSRKEDGERTESYFSKDIQGGMHVIIYLYQKAPVRLTVTHHGTNPNTILWPVDFKQQFGRVRN